MRRLTTIAINRAFRAKRLTARLEKPAFVRGGYWNLKVAAREGGELHRYTGVRRLNRYDLAGWITVAEQGIEWAQKKEARIERHRIAEPKAGLAAIIDNFNLPLGEAMRLTTIAINRAFRAKRLTARLEKPAFVRGGYWNLKVAAREGGEFHRYTGVQRLNHYDLAGWIAVAEQGIEWAQKKEARSIASHRMAEPKAGLAVIVDNFNPQWNAIEPNVERFENDGPLGDAKHVKMEFVHISGRRDWVTVPNGAGLKASFLRKKQDFFGPEWRLSRVAPVPVDDGFRLPAATPPKVPDISFEDAIALAHLVAEDLAEGNLKEDKVRIVQELVGGRVTQASGSYKYVLLVGRWAIKVDKRRKPGDDYYIGAAGEALLIESIKAKHAELAKYFPQTAVVNYFTAVQERADIDQTLYSRQKALITSIAQQANIGDYHGHNVGFRPNDDTPIFIDVAGSKNVHAQDHHHLNKRFMIEYKLDTHKRDLVGREQEIKEIRASVADLTTQLKQLGA